MIHNIYPTILLSSSCLGDSYSESHCKPTTYQPIAGKPFKPFLIHGNLPIPPEFCKLQVDVIRTATKYKVNAIDNVFSDVGVGLQFFGKPHGFAGNAKWLQETKLTTNMRIRTDEDKLKNHNSIKKKAKDKAQLEYEDIMPKVQEAPATPPRAGIN